MIFLKFSSVLHIIPTRLKLLFSYIKSSSLPLMTFQIFTALKEHQTTAPSLFLGNTAMILIKCCFI